MALSKILPASQEVQAIGKNLIINGAMQVAQRGTSFTPSGVTYCLDRFAHYASSVPSNAVQQSTDVPSSEGFQYSVRMDTIDLRHAVELLAAGKAGVFYSGQKLTLSFWAKTGTSTHSPTINMQFIDGAAYSSASSAFSSSNNAVTITDTWQRFAIQYTVDTTPTVSHFACGFSISGSANILYITGVQLEVGETATPFEHRSFGDELAKCQRFWCQSYPHGTAAGSNSSNTVLRKLANGHAYDGIGEFQFPTEMRAAPTVVLYNPVTGTVNGFRGDGGNFTGAGIHGTTTRGFSIYRNAAVTATVFTSIHATCNAEL